MNIEKEKQSEFMYQRGVIESLQKQLSEKENKLVFYREQTDKVRQLVFDNKEIGEPCQPLYDAIVDRLNEYKEECERLAGVIQFWQAKYYALKPPHQNPKIDNL